MIVHLVRAAAVTLGIAVVVAPAVQAHPAAPVRVATLGDLSQYKAITADTLAAANKGNVAEAQKRGTDLETAWDKAEDTLKPTDPVRWRVIDKAIDRVLSELRAAKPDQHKITDALHDLLAILDKGGVA